ncbi:MAG: type II secretion system F family protein, partial [Elusimicrobiota bacterium]
AIFPQGIVDMVSLGEESGNLDKMLLRAADYYSKEADMTLKRVMSLLEPAIIVALGLMVGFIVISILLPVFDLGGAMR